MITKMSPTSTVPLPSKSRVTSELPQPAIKAKRSFTATDPSSSISPGQLTTTAVSLRNTDKAGELLMPSGVRSTISQP